MRLDVIYQKVADESVELLRSFTYYLCATNKKIESELAEYSITALRTEIKSILCHVKYANVDLLNIEMEIEKEANMIECFRRSFYVSGENFDAIGAGHNNGLIRNTVAEEKIKNMEREERMLKEQSERFAQRDLIKKSLIRNERIVLEFIDLIPNELYRKIVYDFYVLGKVTPEIAEKYSISYDYVGKAQARGLASLAQIYKNYLKSEIDKIDK